MFVTVLSSHEKNAYDVFYFFLIPVLDLRRFNTTTQLLFFLFTISMFTFLFFLPLSALLVFAAPSYDLTAAIIPPQPPTPSPTPDSAGFTTRISGDGKSIIVGGQYYNQFLGAVWIYTLNSSNQWQQIGQTLLGPSQKSHFGRAVALNENGTVAAVGAFGVNEVYIYKVNLVTSTITSVQTLKGTGNFGIDVSFNALGTILAVRSKNKGVSPYIYSSNSWVQSSSSNLPAPSTGANSASIALSLDGTTMIIGSYNVSNVVIYSTSDNGLTWGSMVELQTPSTSGIFGYSVALSSDGNVAAVGASGANAYMYSRTNGNWSTYVSIPLPTGNVTGFGASVSMNYDGTIVAVGAPGTNDYVGMVFVYHCSNLVCELQANYTTPTDLLKQVGSSVSFSRDGSILAVGAPCGTISAITTIFGGNGNVPGNPIGGFLVLEAPVTQFPTTSPTSIK